MSITSNSRAIPGLRVYQFFNRLPWLRRSFKTKVLSVAFLGTHVPLLALLAYFLYGNAVTQNYALWVLGMALVATLLGCLATLVTLRALLRPIDLTLKMLGQFREARHLLQPQITLHDEMGTLIDSTARTLVDLEAHLKHAATHDAITGALNTHGLEQAFNNMRAASPEAVALIQMHVRNFTQMEISQSRDEIEFVARIMANRLCLLFPEPCRVAVTGRGQFAVLVPQQVTAAMLEERLTQALTDLTTRMSLGTTQISPVCVLGVASADDSESLNDLFDAAKAAVLAAGEQEGSSWLRAPQAGSEQYTRMRLTLGLDRAIQEAQLFAVYQPRVNVRSTTVESVEALVRWRHPTHGVINPSLFIPMAERTGKILEIGSFMLDQAAAQASAWERAGRDVTVSVNVAAPQITAMLVDDVRAALVRHGPLPQHLELEITETALLASPDDNVSPLQQIRDLGVTIALDDFGTGYSSLSYLSGLPIDRIKIDRSFVSRLDSPRDRQIVEGIVALSRALGLAVTAEGVETPEQAAALAASGCDEWQGFLFAHPTASEEIEWHPQITDIPMPRIATTAHSHRDQASKTAASHNSGDLHKTSARLNRSRGTEKGKKFSANDDSGKINVSPKRLTGR